ncbi:hypothetical protein [Sediminibacterium goheungense]|nr:hypothetical protein [Sediminibacterium goheungense]
MMKAALSFLFIGFTGFINAQYYFNDIVSIRQGNEQYKVWRAQKIAAIKTISYEPDNSITEGLTVNQEISRDGKKVTITTVNNNQTSVTVNTYDLGVLKRTQTNNKNISNKTDYTYDAQGRISKVSLSTIDTFMNSTQAEIHEWTYDEFGAPVSMLKIKNQSDTVMVQFIKDEQGNIGEERWQKKGRTIESYYYYYNTNRQLTDIVRYNSKLKKLLPDFIYEYNTAGQPSQMTQFSLGSNNYFVWKYTYNDKGLKTQEICSDKSKMQVGRIEYQYTIQ